MNIIIDTHIFLWALSEPGKLSSVQRCELETQSNTVYVSAISIVEIMIKASIGKLTIHFNPAEAAKKSGFALLEMSADDALPLKNLPFHHKDPFDRMLVAQSLARNYYLMTDDNKIQSYNCKLI